VVRDVLLCYAVAEEELCVDCQMIGVIGGRDCRCTGSAVNGDSGSFLASSRGTATLNTSLRWTLLALAKKILYFGKGDSFVSHMNLDWDTKAIYTHHRFPQALKQLHTLRQHAAPFLNLPILFRGNFASSYKNLSHLLSLRIFLQT